MTFLRSIILLLIALCCIPVVSATGNGTFSISGSTGVDTGENLTVTVYLENTWSPRASDVYLHLLFNSSVLDYVSTDYRIGHTVAATLDTPGSVFLQFGDFTNGYPNGKYPIADLHFRAVKPGTSRLSLVVDHVRYYVPVDIGDSATATAETIMIGSGPSGTGETVTAATTHPAQTVAAGAGDGETGVPGGTATTVVPGETVQGSVVPSEPATLPATTTSTVTVPTLSVVLTPPITPTPSGEYYAGSDDYTGTVTEQSLTVTTTPTPSPLPTPTTVVTTVTAGLVPSSTTTVQTSTPITTVQSTTTAATPSPQNATTTPTAGTDSGLLALLSLGGIALLSIARRLH